MFELVCVIDFLYDMPGPTIYDRHHYLAALQHKPGALENGIGVPIMN